MGYPVKIQKVERPTNQSYYLNFPSVLAQLLDIKKGELFEWEIETKNLLLLRRVKQKASTKLENVTTHKQNVGKG